SRSRAASPSSGSGNWPRQAPTSCPSAGSRTRRQLSTSALKSHQSDRPEPLPPDIAEALQRARHRLGRVGGRLLYFSKVGSTNDVAAELAESAGSEGAVVIANQQTAGRGRRGRTWFSPPASGLYVSIALVPAGARADPARATPLLPLAAGVALADAVEAAAGLG